MLALLSRSAPIRPSGSPDRPNPVGAEYLVTLRDLGILADQAAEPVPAQNSNVGTRIGRNRTPGRRWSGRPGELHPRAPTERSVSLSVHSALLIAIRPARASRPSGRIAGVPVRSLRSTTV